MILFIRQPKPDEPVLTITGAAPKIEYEQTDATLSRCRSISCLSFCSAYAVHFCRINIARKK